MKRVTLVFALVAAACGASRPGAVRSEQDNPLVTIGAGQALLHGAGDGRSWYVIDTATQRCWFKLADSISSIDCCDLRRVPEARGHIAWENDASCADGNAAPVETPPTATPPVEPPPPAP